MTTDGAGVESGQTQNQKREVQVLPTSSLDRHSTAVGVMEALTCASPCMWTYMRRLYAGAQLLSVSSMPAVGMRCVENYKSLNIPAGAGIMRVVILKAFIVELALSLYLWVFLTAPPRAGN